ncbi:MAG: hypothetical protein HY717_12980 [Planctomycetes bacterium]|nr:hypothetical protein [Planctomycetota bacterium]
MTPARIDALIRLLADDSPKIQRVAREHLRQEMELARPFLEERARHSDDPAVRERARQFITELAREQKLAEWQAFARSPADLDLERGAFLIAEAEYPELDRARYVKILSDCGAVLRQRLAAVRSPEAVAAKLGRLLFHELGLQGNRQDYYHPDNSYLPKVLDRKLGIPISLSAIAMLICRRAGIPLEGIGLPGHFVARYRHGSKEIYFDAFNRGQTLSRDDCRLYVISTGHEPQTILQPASTQEILTRMLRNLQGIYSQKDDPLRLARVEAMLEALEK